MVVASVATDWLHRTNLRALVVAHMYVVGGLVFVFTSVLNNYHSAPAASLTEPLPALLQQQGDVACGASLL